MDILLTPPPLNPTESENPSVDLADIATLYVHTAKQVAQAAREIHSTTHQLISQIEKAAETP